MPTKRNDPQALARLMRLDKAGHLIRLGVHLCPKHLVCTDVDKALHRLRNGESVYVQDGNAAVRVAGRLRNNYVPIAGLDK